MSDNFTTKNELKMESVGYTVTIYNEKEGRRFSVAVNGVSHDRGNMLIVARDLRRAADLIEMRDAK